MNTTETMNTTDTNTKTITLPVGLPPLHHATDGKNKRWQGMGHVKVTDGEAMASTGVILAVSRWESTGEGVNDAAFLDTDTSKALAKSKAPATVQNGAVTVDGVTRTAKKFDEYGFPGVDKVVDNVKGYDPEKDLVLDAKKLIKLLKAIGGEKAFVSFSQTEHGKPLTIRVQRGPNFEKIETGIETFGIIMPIILKE